MTGSEHHDWRSKRFLTYEETVEMLRDAGINVTARTVQRWVRIGKLKATPVTFRVRYIPRTEVERFLKEMESSEQLALHSAAG